MISAPRLKLITGQKPHFLTLLHKYAHAQNNADSVYVRVESDLLLPSYSQPIWETKFDSFWRLLLYSAIKSEVKTLVYLHVHVIYLEYNLSTSFPCSHASLWAIPS